MIKLSEQGIEVSVSLDDLAGRAPNLECFQIAISKAGPEDLLSFMNTLKLELAASSKERRIVSTSPKCSLIKRKQPRRALGHIQLSPLPADQRYATFELLRIVVSPQSALQVTRAQREEIAPGDVSGKKKARLPHFRTERSAEVPIEYLSWLTFCFL